MNARVTEPRLAQGEEIGRGDPFRRAGEQERIANERPCAGRKRRGFRVPDHRRDRRIVPGELTENLPVMVNSIAAAVHR